MVTAFQGTILIEKYGALVNAFVHAVFLCKVINLKRLCSLSKEVSFNQFNPVALRKAKIVYNFGLSECSRVNGVCLAQSVGHLTRKSGVLGSIHGLVLPLFQEGQLSVTGECMCTKYWLTA